jgi:hypothetical protein
LVCLRQSIKSRYKKDDCQLNITNSIEDVENSTMLLIVAQTIPILQGRGFANELDVDGVARVGKTRVTLDTVVSAFNLGAAQVLMEILDRSKLDRELSELVVDDDTAISRLD